MLHFQMNCKNILRIVILVTLTKVEDGVTVGVGVKAKIVNCSSQVVRNFFTIYRYLDFFFQFLNNFMLFVWSIYFGNSQKQNWQEVSSQTVRDQKTDKTEKISHIDLSKNQRGVGDGGWRVHCFYVVSKYENIVGQKFNLISLYRFLEPFELLITKILGSSKIQ